MAAGITCSGATMANVYSRFWYAIIVETATITAMKCSRVVSIVARSFFICSALKIIYIVRIAVVSPDSSKINYEQLFNVKYLTTRLHVLLFL